MRTETVAWIESLNLSAVSFPAVNDEDVSRTRARTGRVSGVATIAVMPEVADLEPPAFVAVTTTRTVRPTSPSPSRYVFPVAPVMFAHALPAVSQSCY